MLFRSKQPFSVDVQESKELPPLGDGLVALASATRLQLILNGPNGTAGRLRGELMFSMVFHVILCIVVADEAKAKRTAAEGEAARKRCAVMIQPLCDSMPLVGRDIALKAAAIDADSLL